MQLMQRRRKNVWNSDDTTNLLLESLEQALTWLTISASYEMSNCAATEIPEPSIRDKMLKRN